MFSCPRCSARYSADAVSSALICPRCQDEDGVFSPLTFWLFDAARVHDQRQTREEAMANQTKAERSRAARKGAATRKENEAKESGQDLKRAAGGALVAAKKFGKAATKSVGASERAARKRADV